MPKIELTSQLAKLAECPAVQQIDGQTLAAALEELFDQHAALRTALLDDNGAVHAHLALFVDGQMIAERGQWDVPVNADSEVFVMQAISGG